MSEGASIASLYHTAASQSMLAMTAATPVSCPILQVSLSGHRVTMYTLCSSGCLCLPQDV